MENYINSLVEDMRKGRDVYFTLIHTDNETIPFLIDAYYREQKLRIRVELIEAVWQHRSVNTLDFLTEVLQDNTPEIWQQALDGIVASARREGLEVLRAEKVCWLCRRFLTNASNGLTKLLIS